MNQPRIRVRMGVYGSNHEYRALAHPFLCKRTWRVRWPVIRCIPTLAGDCNFSSESREADKVGMDFIVVLYLSVVEEGQPFPTGIYATCTQSQCRPFLVLSLLHRTFIALLLTDSPSLASYLFYRQFTVLVHVDMWLFAAKGVVVH